MFELDEIISKSKFVGRESTTGVYFLIKKDEIVYIGSSFDCEMRMKDHRRNWAVLRFDRMFIIPCNRLNKDERTKLEYKYIRKFSPKYNKQGVKDRVLGYVNKGNFKKLHENK